MICRLAGERSNMLVCLSGLRTCQQLLLHFRLSGRRCNLQCEDAVQAAAIADRTLLGSLLMSTAVHSCSCACNLLQERPGLDHEPGGHDHCGVFRNQLARLSLISTLKES